MGNVRCVNDFRWGPANVEALETFCGQGLSASQIAERLGVTRNAVIGKAARMGFKLLGDNSGMRERIEKRRTAREPRPERRVPLAVLRAKASAPPKPVKPAVDAFPRIKAEPVAPIAPVMAIPETAMRLIPLLELGFAGECRWPVREAVPGRSETMLFCGLACGERVYCAGHWALTHEPPRKTPRPSLMKLAGLFR